MKMQFKKTLTTGIAASAILAGGISTALALGPTDDADIDIDAVVPNLVNLTGADDMDLGTWSGSGDMSDDDDVCVWSSTNGYNVTATGDGAAGAFTLSDGSNTLAYTVAWDDIDTQDQSLTSGVALTGQSTDATSVVCAVGGDTANVGVTITEAAVAAAPAGSYSGTLSVTVAAE